MPYETMLIKNGSEAEEGFNPKHDSGQGPRLCPQQREFETLWWHMSIALACCGITEYLMNTIKQVWLFAN